MRLTDCLPLISSHLTLTLFIDDLHPLHKIFELGHLLLLVEDLVKVLLVQEAEVVLEGHAVRRCMLHQLATQMTGSESQTKA